MIYSFMPFMVFLFDLFIYSLLPANVYILLQYEKSLNKLNNIVPVISAVLKSVEKSLIVYNM